MSDVIGIFAIILAIGCMYLGQAKSINLRERKYYSLIGSAASVVIAVEAMARGQAGVALLFAAGAAVSVVTLVLDYLNPGNPDA